MAHPVYPSSIAFTSSTKISSARANGENLHGQSYYFPHLLFNGNNDSESVPSTNPISNLAFIQSWTINYFLQDVPLLQLLVNFSFLGILCFLFLCRGFMEPQKVTLLSPGSLCAIWYLSFWLLIHMFRLTGYIHLVGCHSFLSSLLYSIVLCSIKLMDSHFLLSTRLACDCGSFHFGT